MNKNHIKILMTENQFQNLINEDRGVNRASISYSNTILDAIEPYITNSLKTKKSDTFNIKIPLKDFSGVWESDLEGYAEFPIFEIRIILNVGVLPPSKIDYPFSTGGGAEQINDGGIEDSFVSLPPKGLPKKVKDLIDSSLSAKFTFDVFLRNDISENDKQDLMYDLRDTVLHETNHMLEFFKKHENSKGNINVALSYAGKKNYNVPNDVYEVWREFQTMVYFSEPYEMRAMVQEMYSVRLRKTFEEFKKHRYYQAAEVMENFNADTMFDVLIQRIEEYNPDYLIPILTNLWKWFITEYFGMLEAQGFTPNKKLEKSVHILDVMKVLQPRINKAGARLKRKFNTLYSISPD